MVALPWTVLLLSCGGGGGTPDDLDASAARDTAAALDARGCVTDADCDDGVFCTGTERCGEDGRCYPSAVPCLPAFCDEETDTCDDACAAPDRDGDGHRVTECGGDDCDDANADRFPGQVEDCDGDDEDCDPSTIGDLDADGDGAVSVACCNPAADPACGDDCDDALAAVHPGADDVCNGTDDDCDLATDEGATTDVWPDTDGDGFGDAGAAPTTGCPGEGLATVDGDCAPMDASSYPGAPEACDGRRTDCDAPPVACPAGEDCDGDGHLGTGATCTGGARAGLPRDDCNDTSPSIAPGAVEVCNAIDDDCNGGVDTSPTSDLCTPAIECGTVDCDPATEVCCLERTAPFAGMCLGSSLRCPALRLPCDGPEDCTAGQVCCAARTSSSAGECRSVGSCGCRYCHVDADCSGPPCAPMRVGGMTTPYETCGGCSGG